MRMRDIDARRVLLCKTGEGLPLAAFACCQVLAGDGGVMGCCISGGEEEKADREPLAETRPKYSWYLGS